MILRHLREWTPRDVTTASADDVASHINHAQRLLKAIVIAWDADQDLEFDEALAAARRHLGFRLVDEPDGSR